MSYKLKLIAVFFVLLANAPWFLIVVSNRSLLLPYTPERNSQEYEISRDKANILRADANALLHQPLPKILANKYIFIGRDYLKQYAEVFDPHVLFFASPNDPVEYPPFSGLLYLSYLPLFIFGVAKTKPWLIFLLLLSAFLPAVYFSKSIFLYAPFLVLFILISAKGLLGQNHKIFKFFIVIYLVFEILRFYHNYYVHYPFMI